MASEKLPEPQPSQPAMSQQENEAASEASVRRPRLVVRPVPRPAEQAPPRPAVRGGTLFKAESENSQADAPAGAAPATPSRAPEAPTKIVLPPGHMQDPARFAFATHRAAPAEQKAAGQPTIPVPVAQPERQVSAGFVLGIALIAVSLLGGIFIIRLGSRVRQLERRVGQLENAIPAAQFTAARRP